MRLTKSSFRPIIYGRVAPSPFSLLRLDFVRKGILIGKAQHFMNTSFIFSSFSYIRFYVLPIHRGVGLFVQLISMKNTISSLTGKTKVEIEVSFGCLLRRSHDKHTNSDLAW